MILFYHKIKGNKNKKYKYIKSCVWNDRKNLLGVTKF